MRKIISIVSIYVCMFNHAVGAVIEINKHSTDSLWAVWNNPSKHDTDRLNAIDVICWQVYLFSQPDSAYYYAHQQYNFATKKNVTKFQAKALNIIGTFFTLKNNTDSAMKYYQKGLILCKEPKDFYSASSILNNMSNLEYYDGNYAQSLKYIYESLKISEQLKDEYLITSNLLNIGTVYGDLGDRKKEMDFYQLSLKHARIANDKNITKSILINIGNNYYNGKIYSKSMPFYQEALKMNYEVNDMIGISYALLYLGRGYNEMGNNDSALYCLDKSLKLLKKLNDQSGIGNIYDIMATVYYSKADYPVALMYSKESLEIGKKEESNFLIRNAAETLYKIYKKTNLPKEALEMFELYKNVNDSIINDNNNKALLRSQIEYEFDKKEDIIKQQTKIKDLKLSRRTYMIVVLVIIVVLSYLIYYLIIKQNKLLAAKKAIELEQKLLGSQMNTHFTFNAINSIQEYILNNQNEEAHYFLSEYSKLMRTVLTHNRKKLISISSEIELLKKYILFEEQRLKDKIEFTVVNTGRIDLDTIEIPSMLLQPLIENSIWHGLRFQSGQKKIQVTFTKESNDTLKIEVADNGVGLNANSNTVDHTSHGINIVKERIMLLYSKEPEISIFEIKNNPDGEGVVTKIIIPFINEFE